ncbi:MAG: LptF/LptG family permease [Desulfoplanes sp.]
MKNKILIRYLIRQNLFYLALVFGAGISIYFLIELFDRLDDFLKAGVSAKVIVIYFLAKTPLIIAQIFPAVFLLALIIQFSLMHRHREIVALQACAISFVEIGRVILLYSLVWSCLLFGFSQILGTKGYGIANRIWKEDVRKKQLNTQTLTNIWFRDGRSTVKIRTFRPFQGTGTDAVVYTLSRNGRDVERILQAKTVSVKEGTWRFGDVTIITPRTFSQKSKKIQELSLDTDPRTFVTLKSDHAPEYLSFWQLEDVIQGLTVAGSNVENLLTALYTKISYPCALVVMACMAIVLTLALPNVYACVVSGLLLIFAYYATFVIGSSAGDSGVLPPLLAAWLANLIFGSVFGGTLVVTYVRQR